MSSNLLVTIIISVRNGGERLRECLQAVLQQKAPCSYEVLCVDRGSTDASLATIRSLGCRLIELAPEASGHGGALNFAIAQTRTPIVALLSQDAVPDNEHWLAELLCPMLGHERIAGVFGPSRPHAGCMPAEAYRLERHFRQFGQDTTVYAIGPGPEGWAEYESRRDFYRSFSGTNAALRRVVWSQLPFQDIESMAAQRWCADVLEAGYARAYAPRAVVRHGHGDSLRDTFRRAFDESRCSRQSFQPGLDSYERPERWIRRGWRTVKSDVRELARDAALSAEEKLRAVGSTVGQDLAREAGALLGDRHELLPESLIRRISPAAMLPGDAARRSSGPSARQFLLQTLHRLKSGEDRISLVTELARKGLTASRHARRYGVDSGVLKLRQLALPPRPRTDWWNTGVFRYLAAYRAQEPRPAPRPPANPERLTLNWVVPGFARGSGGHTTIFRMIHHLERAGHQSRIYLFDARKELPPEGLRCQRLIQEWFAPISAPVLHLTADMLPADAVIATSWKTAYPVRDSSCAPAKCYFVQDFEPLFVAMSSEWLFAEATYRFGFFGLTLGPWLTKICEERFGMTCRSVPIAVDHQEYHPVAGPKPARRRLFVYMRPVTPRRGHELVTLALKRIHEAMPEVEIHVAGWELAPDSLPFPFVGHGIVSPAGLRELFSSCEVAVCVSLTNYSLMPLEMAACGCPVVDIDAENTRIAYPPGAIVLAPLTPEGIAKEVLGLLQDEAYRQRQREAGLRYARSVSWEDSARLLQEALRDAVRARGEEKHLRAG